MRYKAQTKGGNGTFDQLALLDELAIGEFLGRPRSRARRTTLVGGAGIHRPNGRRRVTCSAQQHDAALVVGGPWHPGFGVVVGRNGARMTKTRNQTEAGLELRRKRPAESVEIAAQRRCLSLRRPR